MSEESVSEESVKDSVQGRRKVRKGTVVSDTMDKTVVVSVERQVAHPLYTKRVKRRKKYHAHDETNEFRTGDIVTIEETRSSYTSPGSMKTWRSYPSR